jgi:subtilisin family serine protease
LTSVFGQPGYYSNKYGFYIVPDAIVVNFNQDVGELTISVKDGIATIGFASIDEKNRLFKVIKIEKLFPGEKSPAKGSKLPDLSSYYRLTCAQPIDIEMMVDTYQRDYNIEHSEPIGIHRVYVTPDDPQFSIQWALYQFSDRDIDATDAWDVCQGDTTVKLAIIDTGVDWDHPDLGGVAPFTNGNIWINWLEYNGTSGVDDDGNGYIDDVRGWDWVNVPGSGIWPGEDSVVPDSNPMDFNGHGTHCSGISSAITNNATGVAGIGWKCKIMSLRAGWEGNDGNGYVRMDFCAPAINYARQKGAIAANCSWGSSNSGGIGAAVDAAIAAGMVICVAAGNSNNQIPSYLGSRGDCIDVAATDQNDVKAGFSTYGAWVDVSAPGVSIRSTLFNNTYAYMSGTSMAAPQVTGLTGLIKSQRAAWTRAQLCTLIVRYTDFIDTIAGNVSYAGLLGSGRINAWNSLSLHDVGPIRIVDPTGVVDSGTVIVPVCSLRNYSPRTKEKFRVTLRIGSTYLQTRVESLPPNSRDTILFPAWTASPLGTFLVRCTTALFVDTMFVNDTLSDSVIVRSLQVEDVGAVAILDPVGRVDSAQTIVPRCSVYNYGDALVDSFPVIFRITGPGPTIWTDTTMVYNLDTVTGTTVSFNAWTAGRRGNYTTRCTTAYDMDMNTTNDRQDSVFTVAVHDVGVTDIVSPTGSVPLNSVVPTQTRIRNYGSVTDSFNVILTIGGSYVDTVFTTINAGVEDIVNFTPWTATPVGTHSVRCTTALTGDLITVNDTLSGLVNVYDDDVGVVSILKPILATESTATIAPQCSVYNYGSSPATFNVTFRISGIPPYTNTQPVNNLAPNTGTSVPFAPWTVGPRGNYTARCSTELSPDTSALNDTLSSSFSIIVHDVGVTQILAPRGVVALNQNINPQAVIRNYGTQVETFNVGMAVLTPVPSTFSQSITLGVNQVDTADFSLATWTASPVGTFGVRCSTELANDSVAVNNLMIDSVTVSDADVGVTAIVAPAGNLDSTSTITPLVSLFNYGTNPATFPAILRISGAVNYVDTQIVNLAGGVGLTVPFAPWTVGPRGNYLVRCTTALAFDTSAANDTMSRLFSIIVHDVGTTQILAPSGVVALNRSVTAQTVVRNYGTQVETFNVGMVVLTPVPTTWSVSRTLLPDQVDTINFAPNWTASPVGTFGVRCSTELVNDSVAVNNLMVDSVIVSDADVGVTAIVFPAGAIDSSATLVPQATVFNYGSGAASFPVILRISGPASYTDTFNVLNLAPGTPLTVPFAPWTIGPRGLYLVRCSTALNIDTSARNDTLSQQFEIIVHNAGVTQILAPTGVVPLNSNINPQARVRNYGSENETFDVMMWIGASYADTVPITLAPNTEDFANFAAWLATPIGTQTVRCSTALSGDLVVVNDTLTDSVQVVAFDVGLNSINAPVGIVDSATTPTVVPQATMTNYATTPVTFPAIFRIQRGSYVWADTQNFNLNAGQTSTLNFNTWTVSTAGTYATRCTTSLVGDVNISNNHTDSVFRVQVPGSDVGVTALILNPSLPSVDSGTVITISARVKNFGTDVATFQVKTRIGSFYLDSLLTPLTLNPGESTPVNFANWNALQRGTQIVRCSTLLTGDIDPSNNRRTQSVAVLVRDVRVFAIDWPTGNIDSTATPLIPSARVENLGNVAADSFPVIFRLAGPVAWGDTKMVRNLSAGEIQTKNFNPWTIGPVGAYTTACSTAYPADMNPLNDRRTGQFWIQRCDIQVDSIISPLGVVDSGSTQPVQASMTNLGTSTKTFLAIFRIGSFYVDTVPVTLASDSGSIIAFNNWVVNQTGGTYPVQCTTVIANDINEANNQDTGSVLIGVKDVAIDSILNPTATVSPGPMIPQARVHNFGTDTISFYAYCRIRNATGTQYFDSTLVDTLAPDSILDVSFSAWNAVNGNYIATCSLAIPGDMVQANDTLSLSFTVTVRDVGVSRIVYPGPRTLRGPIQPRTVVMNYSGTTESFMTWFQVTDVPTSIVVYFDSAYCSALGQGLQRIIDYPVWTATFGNYSLKCSTGLIGDANPANDTMTALCRVDTIIVPKWAQKRDMPEGPRGRYVRKGGSITFGGNNTIFAFKGSNTNEFYTYNLSGDTWTAEDTVPSALERRKRVGGGAALCWDEQNTIFALKGSNTLEFWAYFMPFDTWLRLPDVPAGTKRIKNGSGLIFVSGPTGDNVYCLKGSKTFEFYSYSINTNTWTTLRNVPAGFRGKSMYTGSAITYDPNSGKIYAVKGNENEFYAYDIAADSWITLVAMPLVGVSGQKRAKDGAALVADGSGLVYAFKGNNSQEFWAYHTDRDWWEQVDPIPLGPNYRKVKQGGCLTYASVNQKIYALKGNRTLELWTFDPNALFVLEAHLGSASGRSNTTEEKSQLAAITEFKVSPNPNSGRFAIDYKLSKIGSINCNLYNVLGELVLERTIPATNNSGVMKIDAKEIPTGVYILKIASGGTQFVGKILIQK